MNSYKFRGEFKNSQEIISCDDLHQLYRMCMMNLTTGWLEQMRKSECVHIYRSDEIRPVVTLVRHSDDHGCEIKVYYNYKEYSLRKFSFDEEEGYES